MLLVRSQKDCYMEHLEIRGQVETIRNVALLNPGNLMRLVVTRTPVKTISKRWCEKLTRGNIIMIIIYKADIEMEVSIEKYDSLIMRRAK